MTKLLDINYDKIIETFDKASQVALDLRAARVFWRSQPLPTQILTIHPCLTRMPMAMSAMMGVTGILIGWF